MSLDLRLPIGLLFVLLGALLGLYGLVSDPAIYAASLGVNVNLWWGAVMLVFGGAMFVPAVRKMRSLEKGVRPLFSENSGRKGV
jgi:hypothetical protein